MSDLQLGPWLDDFANGLWVTIYVTVISAALALVIAFVLGLMARLKPIVPRTIARVIIELFRGTSLLVQLYWFAFALPPLVGFFWNPTILGPANVIPSIIAFSLNFGAYGAEIVRGSINAVAAPQWEAAVALNLTPYQRMRRVILPQAVPLMIPPFNNLLIQLLKSTPLMFLVSVTDFLTTGDFYRRSSEGRDHYVFLFTAELVVYFLLAYAFTLILRGLEARAKARLGRGEPARKIFSFRGPSPEEALPDEEVVRP
jgi:polar amino acid transport system permease protein